MGKKESTELDDKLLTHIAFMRRQNLRDVREEWLITLCDGYAAILQVIHNLLPDAERHIQLHGPRVDVTWSVGSSTPVAVHLSLPGLIMCVKVGGYYFHFRVLVRRRKDDLPIGDLLYYTSYCPPEPGDENDLVAGASADMSIDDDPVDEQPWKPRLVNEIKHCISNAT